MVTAPEAAALLAYAAGYDNRQPDQFAASSWAEALEDIDFTDARQVIKKHYQSTRDWIMPSDVINGVRAMERARIDLAPNLDEVEPPLHIQAMEDGPDFTAAYLAWRKEQARRVRRGLPLEVGPPAIPVPRQLVS
jgi:hypothetical protein